MCSGKFSMMENNKELQCSIFFQRFARQAGNKSSQHPSAQMGLVSCIQSPFGHHSLHLVVVTLYIGTILLSGSLPIRAQAVNQGLTLKTIARAWSVSFSDWEQSDDPCTGLWSGVTCDKATNTQVLVLNLTAKGLKGPMPPEIGDLMYLEELYIDNNTIWDPIPVEIGKLTRLRRLNISANSLTIPPPDALLKCNLTHLSLSVNKMTGQLPSWISQLSNLVLLEMYTNMFWGGLPPEYGQLKNLQDMELWGNELSGFIPDEWRQLTSLSRIALGHQYITGSVPEWLFELPAMRYIGFYRNQFLGQFPNITKYLHNGIANLDTLRVACNFLQGDYATSYYNTLPVPRAIIQSFSNCLSNEIDTNPGSLTNGTENTPTNCSRVYDCASFYEQVYNNPGNCAPCPPSQIFTDVSNCICGKAQIESNLPIRILVGGIVGGVCAAVLAILLCFLFSKKTKQIKYPEFGRRYGDIKDHWTIPGGLQRFTLLDLEKATDCFSDKYYIGTGGFGNVYRGILGDGKPVAIKCAAVNSTQGLLEFRNELELMTSLHHRHLTNLEGFCDEDGLQILIYEFAENGNLLDNLFGQNGKALLDSAQRVQIAIGIARGLDYLHCSVNPPVIHRDIKPSNILLDLYMVAKLADFGISKASTELATHISTRPMGTMGYLDPGYFRTNQLTTASDIYAFGVVLLEIITGQHSVDFKRSDAFNLIEWVKPIFKQEGIQGIIDNRLEMYDKDTYTIMTELAFKCTEQDRKERPSIKMILNTLEPYVKGLERLQYDAMWSTAHFKNKALFEQEPSLKFTDGAAIPSSSLILDVDKMADSTANSFDDSLLPLSPR